MPVDIDFSPLGDLYNTYRRGQQEASRREVLGQLGQGGGPIDYSSAARALLAAGDTEGGLSLARLGQQQYLSSPEYITQSETARARVAEQFAPKTTDVSLPGGEKVTVQKGPSGYEVPTIRGMPAPDPNAPQPPPGVDAKKWREVRATQSANIDDKAVFEADKNVLAGESAKKSLERAIELSKTAFAGPFAGQRGYYASLTGPGAGADTQELANVTTNQALETLRAVFGGNPTEGERKILLDVQGAPNQSQEVRERIYKSALDAVNRRTEFYRNTAEQMRSGKYLLPEAQRNQQPQTQSAGRTKENITAARANPQATIAEAKAAIAAGKDPNAVKQRLRQIGIDPSGL